MIYVGWAAFRWDSWAGYGIIFATVVTIASWILIGWLIYREAYGAVATPEPRTLEGAKWLREECPGHEVGTISEINLYPVKGAAQVSVQEAKVEATGFEGDRRCMCITASDNNFYTQRDNPKMALLVARNEPDGTLVLSAAGSAAECRVTLGGTGQRKQATIWDEPYEAIHYISIHIIKRFVIRAYST